MLAIGAVLYGGVDFALPHIFGTPQPVHHAGPEQSTEDHAQPKVSPADVESDLIKQLNRSRLAGRWVRHDDGSYRWNSYAVTLRLPVAGGEKHSKRQVCDGSPALPTMPVLAELATCRLLRKLYAAARPPLAGVKSHKLPGGSTYLTALYEQCNL